MHIHGMCANSSSLLSPPPAVGGTGLSIWIGRPLVRLNFQQEAQEANFRWVG